MTASRFIYKLFAFFIIFFFCNRLYAEESGVIIVNKSIKIETISKSDIRKIYLGKMTLWGNKSKIQPCIINIKTEFGKKFFDAVLSTTPKKYKRHWLKQVFSGYGSAPHSFATPEEVIEFVSKNPGGIGFIPKANSESLKNCNIIKLDSEHNLTNKKPEE